MKYSFLIVFLTAMACKATSQQVPDRNTGGGGDKKNEMKDPEADCNMDLEYDESNNTIYHTKSGLPFTGVCHSYYEDGTLEREAHFRDGKEDGEVITLYKFNAEKGRQIVQSNLNFKTGTPHGKWEFYFENGNKAWENNYNEGEKEGAFTWYYEDGKKKKEEMWKSNLKHGACKDYYEGEKPKTEINYKEGVMEGKYITWFDNGQTEYEATFKDGKEEGEMVTYYKNAQMQTQGFYKDGVPEGEWKAWYEDGKEKSTGRYVKGIKEGEFKQFFSDGQLKKLEVYVAGKVTLVEEYDEFGNKLDPEEKKDEDDE